MGNVSVPGIFRGHEGLREFWRSYRSTFGEMRSEFRNVFATEEGAALEWTTQGTSNGDSVAYDGVSICLSSRHGRRGNAARELL